MPSEEIMDAFRKVTEVYEYVDNLIFNLDNICGDNGFEVPNKIPRILKFSYNVDSKFINTEWGKIHSIIKLYQRSADKVADNKYKHYYAVATLFDFCYFCNKPLIVIAKYTCDSNSKPLNNNSYTTFWRYYWPIQRRISNEFKFEQHEPHNEYFKSKTLVKKYHIEETVFKEIDFLELCKDNIKEAIFDELNKIQNV